MSEIIFPEKNIEDKYINISQINRQFRKIAAVRAWQEYHTPKNLAAAIVVEASELLAEFQWLTPTQALDLSTEKKTLIAHEVADVIMYLSELCEQLGIDIAVAAQQKFEINQQRFINNENAE
jgi:dCTP diphosphatase